MLTVMIYLDDDGDGDDDGGMTSPAADADADADDNNNNMLGAPSFLPTRCKCCVRSMTSK